ncbi:MAG: hypothetical protein GEEBNDBF_01100 [bacterium]|nr:hypothetical protein [bacterium]
MDPLPGMLEPKGSFDAWMMVNGAYLGGGFLGLIALVILSIAILSFLEIRLSRRVDSRMEFYAQTVGEVLKSKLIEGRSRHGTRYYVPVIEYQYQVDGKTYKSHRIYPAEFGESVDKAWGEQLVANFPVGLHFMVYFDPERPRDCVVIRDPSMVKRSVTGHLVMGILMVITAVWIIWAVFTKILPEAGKPLPQDWYGENVQVESPWTMEPVPQILQPSP